MTFSKRHQRSIVPQQRTQAGKFKPKPARKNAYSPDRMLRPQAMPTMPTANNGAIGES